MSLETAGIMYGQYRSEIGLLVNEHSLREVQYSPYWMTQEKYEQSRR
jgi:hypothetical protein